MTSGTTTADKLDLICFSHLGWDFVFQRPQHLMSRFARTRRVFFVEEPVYRQGIDAALQSREFSETGVVTVTPTLPETARKNSATLINDLLKDFMDRQKIVQHIEWFYTPLALDFASDLAPVLTVYDCMDELSLFKGASARICHMEQELFRRADLVFTGGTSLFEAKRDHHPNVHAFPSGVDVAHFLQARSITTEFAEHKHIGSPRLGYAGVIDERLDIDLINQLSEQKPEWQIVMLGPVVKIDPETLPRRHNLHWLGMKNYHDLPQYFAGWDVGLLPFAMNEATRFISPTKTPEYLAAGLQVVSTPIRDVVTPYGDLGMALIGHSADEFISACEKCIAARRNAELAADIDTYLGMLSWEDIWNSMSSLMRDAIATTHTPVVFPEAWTRGTRTGSGALRV